MRRIVYPVGYRMAQRVFSLMPKKVKKLYKTMQLGKIFFQPVTAFGVT